MEKRRGTEEKYECRKAHNDYVSKLISPDKKYPNKRFWSYVKSHRQECSGIPTIVVLSQKILQKLMH